MSNIDKCLKNLFVIQNNYKINICMDEKSQLMLMLKIITKLKKENYINICNFMNYKINNKYSSTLKFLKVFLNFQFFFNFIFSIF